MVFSRQGYRSGLPFPSPGDLPNPGVEPRSVALQADSLLSQLPGKLSPEDQLCINVLMILQDLEYYLYLVL